MTEKKLDAKQIAGFTIFPSWEKKGRTVTILLSLVHQEVSKTHRPLPAESVTAILQDTGGMEWPCAQAPKGELVAITGPGTTSLARFAFKEPYRGSTPSTLTVSVNGIKGSFSLE